MQRSFTDGEFKTFVLSVKLSANALALAETLKQWKQVKVYAAAQRSLAYLPPLASALRITQPAKR